MWKRSPGVSCGHRTGGGPRHRRSANTEAPPAGARVAGEGEVEVAQAGGRAEIKGLGATDRPEPSPRAENPWQQVG